MIKAIFTARGVFNVRFYGEQNLQALILAHGSTNKLLLASCSTFFKRLLHYCLDLRGMGDSNRELEINLYEKDKMDMDLFSVADELNIDRFFLGGHDCGGVEPLLTGEELRQGKRAETNIRSMNLSMKLIL